MTDHAAPDLGDTPTRRETRSRLFLKYVGLFVAVVCVALVINGLLEVWGSYREHKSALIRIQHEQAEAAATKISQFIKEIENQVGWTTQLLWSAETIEQRRFDALRLLRQVPAITELAQVDASGKEQLRVSRLAMDVLGSGLDLSNEPKFTEAVKNKVYYGPVYFRRESEPYMTLSLAGTRRDAGVSIAEVNLKLIWDVVSRIKVGERGQAYVVDRRGRLIAHPDISLVLRNTDMTRLAQVQAAQRGTAAPEDEIPTATDLQGRTVLTAFAPVAPLGWTVFVELPLGEAYQPLMASIQRSALVLLAALCLAAVAGIFLARRMVVPIQALRTGAARIGSGDLSQRIEVKTGDELEALADQFNDMAGRLQESYTGLENKVEQRTQELAQSVKELRALGEVTQAVNSTVDLETVLSTIVAKAAQLSNTEAGAIYVFDEVTEEFRLRATYGLDSRAVAEIRDRHIRLGETAIGEAALQRTPIQIPDLQNDPSSTLDIIIRAGFRALLIIPLLSNEQIVGALVVRRRLPGEFSKSTVELLQTFGAQSVLAIQNARLFESVGARTRELAKSLDDLRTAQDRLVQTEKLASLGQLTAGIAHEIKNPLNFVNNFSSVSSELVGELRDALKGVNLDSKLRTEIDEIADMLQGNLEKVVQHGGKRADSIVKNMLLHSRQGSGEHRFVDVNAVVEESLNLAYHGARAEKQGFNITLEKSFDPGAGEVDLFPQEITRVLLNLIMNGFYAATKRKAEANGADYEPKLAATTKSLGDSVEIRIRDNGTGIPPEVKEKMFNPFFTTKPAGEGTGLGLSISHDIIVKQHGGSIEVDTKPGQYTEFRIVLPRKAATPANGGMSA